MITATPKHDTLAARRLTWALRGVGATLKSALARDESAQAVRLRENAGEDLVQALGQMIMERADPTANKRFTPWLIREYAAGRLILEDLGPAQETLTLFQRYASRLKPEQRDIQRYDNLASAWQAVREFAERDEAHSNRAQKALERARAYAESRILRQDPDGFTVAVPLTEFAAKWWGRGTRWCTAAEKDNAFWHYHAEAHLFVIVIPGHGKFQMWVHADEFQFMDAADQPVSAAKIRVIWPWVGALLRTGVEKSGSRLSGIPRKHRTYDLCLAAVQQNGFALQDVPPKQRTYNLCLAAVQQYGWALEWVPEKHRTQGLCAAAVGCSGKALQFVPQEHRTYDLCLSAVQQSGWALEAVPQEHRTYELCLAAVQQTGRALESVPREHRTYDLCLAAVRQNGSALYLVPKEHSTYDLCLAAVHQYGQALEDVPEKFLDYDLCLAAVQQSGAMLEAVPRKHRSYHLCLASVAEDGEALEFVPVCHRTYDLCLAAVQRDGRALEWVPQRHQTYNLCLAAVQQDGEALNWVPDAFRFYEICRAAVRQNGEALYWVPQQHRTDDLYLAALKNTRTAITFIPEHLHAELLAKLSPGPEPVRSWDLDILTTWAERLNTAPQPSMVQHA